MSTRNRRARHSGLKSGSVRPRSPGREVAPVALPLPGPSEDPRTGRRLTTTHDVYLTTQGGFKYTLLGLRSHSQYFHLGVVYPTRGYLLYSWDIFPGVSRKSGEGGTLLCYSSLRPEWSVVWTVTELEPEGPEDLPLFMFKQQLRWVGHHKHNTDGFT